MTGYRGQTFSLTDGEVEAPQVVTDAAGDATYVWIKRDEKPSARGFRSGRGSTTPTAPSGPLQEALGIIEGKVALYARQMASGDADGL